MSECQRAGCAKPIRTKRARYCSHDCAFQVMQAGWRLRRKANAERMRQRRALETPEQRSQLARKARAVATYRFRSKRFRALIGQLPQRMTREDLLAVLMQAYDMGRHAMYQGLMKKQKRAA